MLDNGKLSSGGWGQGVDADTPFVLGSISKSFTTLAVMRLVDRGDVNLDAPVRRYLVERVSGGPFGNHVTQHIFEPPGRTHSQASIPAARASGMPEGSTVRFGTTNHQKTPDASAPCPTDTWAATPTPPDEAAESTTNYRFGWAIEARWARASRP
ncbi:MAG: hypothetical protein QOE58_2010 [Actinomycetota bacterium]|nr:hypothetical protein [Actinomycetota bacterium]